MEFDFAAARKAGATDDQIVKYLAENYADTFDFDGAFKAGASAPDVVGYLESKYARAPEVSKEEGGDFLRGAGEAFQQVPQLGYGLLAGAGAVAEKITGEGGISTAVKETGVEGFRRWGEKVAEGAKESDSWSYSYDKAKQGDFNALVDWFQHGIGYAAGQGIQILGTAGIGALAAKGAGLEASRLAAGMVSRESARIAATEAGAKLGAEELAKIATANVAAKIGQNTALAATAFGMEGGEIYGDLVSEASKAGKELSGADLGKAFVATTAAGGLEFVGDRLGFDLMLGKKVLGITGVGGRIARGVTGATAGMVGEGATEYGQTLIEEAGKGKDPFSPESLQGALDAAAMGALGGAAMGGVGGVATGTETAQKPQPTDILAENTVDDAIQKFAESVATDSIPADELLDVPQITQETASAIPTVIEPMQQPDIGTALPAGDVVRAVSEPGSGIAAPAAGTGVVGGELASGTQERAGDAAGPDARVFERAAADAIIQGEQNAEAIRSNAGQIRTGGEEGQQAIQRSAGEGGENIQLAAPGQPSEQQAERINPPEAVVFGTNSAGKITLRGVPTEKIKAVRDKLGMKGVIIGKDNAVFPKGTDLKTLQAEFDVVPAPSMPKAKAEPLPAEERARRAPILKNAKALGIKTVARPFSEIEKDVLAAHEAEHAAAVDQLSDAEYQQLDDAATALMDKIAGADEKAQADLQATIDQLRQQYSGREYYEALTNYLEGLQNEPEETGRTESGAGDNQEAGRDAEGAKPAAAEQVAEPSTAQAVNVKQEEEKRKASGKKLEVLKAQAAGKISGDQGAALKELADAGEHAAVDEVLKPANVEAIDTPSKPVEKSAENVQNEIDQTGGVRFSKGKKDSAPSLIIQHNLSEQNLLHADRMGGIPIPSLAITQAEHPLESFGEITLVGGIDMADPKGYAATKVFGADIYSPRYPQLSYKLDSGALKKLNDVLSPYREGRQIYGGEIQRIDDVTQIDAFREYAKAQGVDQNKYYEQRALAEQLMLDVGAEEKIFQGFTNSGNRKYIPHTLDNVIKLLKKELRGGEGFNYGVGSIRSKYTPQFKSIEQIRKAKDRLMTSDTFKNVKEEIDTDFTNLADEFRSYHPIGSEFGFLDTMSSTLYDAATMGLPRAFRENGFESVPQEKLQAAAEFLDKLRTLPTEYFEAKILRAVDLSEFKGAVVPEGTSQKALDVLKARGITNVLTYNKNDVKDRSAKIKQLAEQADLLFSQSQSKARNPYTITTIRSVINEAMGKGFAELLEATDKFKIIPSEQVDALLNGGDKFSKVGTDENHAFFARTTLQFLKDTGFEESIDADGNIRVYHGTSKKNAAAIEKSGKFNGFPFLSPDKKIAEKFSRQAGANPVVMEAVVDPGAVLPTGGYLSARMEGLKKGDDGVWRLSQDIRYSKDGRILAFVTGGKTYFVADNISSDDSVKGLLHHELGVHALQLGRTDEEFQGILKRIESMRKMGDKRVKAAFARVPSDTPAHLVAEEAAGYLAESNPDMPIIQKLIARFRALLRSIGRSLPVMQRAKWFQWAAELSVDDILLMAQDATRRAPQELPGTKERGIFKSNLDFTKPEAQTLTSEANYEQGRTTPEGLRSGRQGKNLRTIGGGIPREGWAEGTRVTRGGEPFTVHRGSEFPLESSHFEQSALGRSTGHPSSGLGVWFTSHHNEAAKYGNVESFKLDIRNPAIIKAEDLPGDLNTVDDYYALREEYRAKGNDGLVIHAKHLGKPEIHFVAFDPEQVISQQPLFSRRGGDQIVEPGNPASWDSPEPSKLDDIIYTLQDKHIDMKRVVQAVKDAGGKLIEKFNPYLAEELFHGRAAKRTQDFVNTELKPLLTDMRLHGLTVDELGKYLHARHAKEANALIAERDQGMPDGGSGMTNAEADEYMSELDEAKRKRLESSAAKVGAIIAKTRDLYVSYGLISKEQADSWAAMFKHYVPLMREDHDGGMGVGQGFSIRGKETKSRTGSTAKVVDILANIALQRERAITRGEKNRVAVALAGLAKLNPNDDFWTVDKPPTERVFNEKTWLVEDRIDPLFKRRQNVVVAKIKDASGQIQERAVIFNEDNARAVRMAESFKNLDHIQLGGVMGASAKITRYFASVNTQYNPVFGIVNITRDVQGMALNLSSTPLAKHRLDVLKLIPSAVKGIYQDSRAERKGKAATSKWAQLWEELQDEGGMTGYRDLYKNSEDRAEAIERELDPTKWQNSALGKIFTANGTLKVPLSYAQKKAGWLFDWLSDYNQTLEGATRLAAYKVAIDNGMTKQEAASLAKNVTVNFNRKGHIGQQAGAMYAFFNAAMQGTARIAQTMLTYENGKVGLTKAGKAIVYGGMTLGALQAVALFAAGFDDDDPPEFVRERALIFPVGGKKYITLPMPLGFHVFPNFGRIPMEWALGGFKDTGKRVTDMIGIFLEAFNPIGSAGMSLQTFMPTAIDPMIALAENKDWTGKPIYKEDFNTMKPTPGFMRNKDTATAWSKGIAEGLNYLSGGTDYTPGAISPTADQIDFLIGQVTGGVGRELGKAAQTGEVVVTGEALPPHKVPLVGRFYGSAESQSSQGNAYYSNLKRIYEVEAELKGRREDRLPTEEYKRDNPEWKLITRAKYADNIIHKLKKKKRELVDRGAEKETIRTIEDRITNEMRRLNEAVRTLE